MIVCMSKTFTFCHQLVQPDFIYCLVNTIIDSFPHILCHTAVRTFAFSFRIKSGAFYWFKISFQCTKHISYRNMILSLLIGCINALDNPTRQAFYPSLVAKEHLSNAIALNSAVINGSRLIGPAVGGVLIGIFGEGLCFLLNGISYLGVIIALFLMRLSPFTVQHRRQNVLTDIQEGFSYVSARIR